MKDGGPAFPQSNGDWISGTGGSLRSSGGMTIRDYFAAKAMQALVLANEAMPPGDGASPEQIAKDSYQQSDAMLKERDEATPS